MLNTAPDPQPGQPAAPLRLDEHIVEIISDSGEGAQKCGQAFGSIAARCGKGTWTIEIIPAEIQPPARSIAGASGNRVRLAATPVNNGGDEADLVVAFNEQVLVGRVRAGELKPNCIILLENKWRRSSDRTIAANYAAVHQELVEAGYRVYEVPLQAQCELAVPGAQRGGNMFVLGMLCALYALKPELGRAQIRFIFANKSAAMLDGNLRLFDAGHAWALSELDFRFEIPSPPASEAQVIMNGNTGLALGIVASGMECCAMYPITPATSASHYLSAIFDQVGGHVHQAEDEIAACCYAIGASYAGKCAVTITSGPGYSLKQEALGLAVMGEIPLVVIDVQRGGPSTGQPTKVEQGDLLQACFGGHGDAPKVVLAASSIEDCFYAVITARKIAETFNTVVVILSDANLATSQQAFKRPQFDPGWLAAPPDLEPLPEGAQPYDWDPRTGMARRFIPGQAGGMYTLTGLAHDRSGRVVYDPTLNQQGLRNRSLKLAALQKTLRTPKVHGDESGELLLLGWGSTKGAIEEAVDRARQRGCKVSSLHLRFIQPLPSGIGEIMRRFDQVLTIENNWCDRMEDELIDADNRRMSNLAILLRSRYLVDVDCWSEVRGQPSKPATIVNVILQRLGKA